MQTDFYGRRPRGQAAEPAAVRIELDAEDPAGAARDGLRLRPGRLLPANEAVMVVSSADPRPLSRIIDVAEQLELSCPEDRYPRQLVRVLRWDDTPGAQRLLCSWRGHRADALPPGVTLAGPLLREAARDLFTALDCVHRAGLVHGAVTLDRLWWDDLSGLQLAGLEHARPRTSPGRHQDLRAAGRLLFHLATGEDLRPGEPRGEIERRLKLLDDWPSRLLTDLLVADQPPDAGRLVRKLSPRPTTPLPRISAEYRRALADFDELRAGQRRFRSSSPPPRPWRAPQRRRADEERPRGAGRWAGSGAEPPGAFRRGVQWLRNLAGLSLLLAAVTR
ncbi:hypothetical protein ACFRAR_08130 [Kitasatospora sp. NPDC056651]|uniref:hypothetical protein n=1 Tax=Kitasatospora sp. NPDC056651 TaxID=3345892 RepID=UPI0036A6ADCA